jgi:hypothetical protein
MTDTKIYVRDPDTSDLFPIKLLDNGDGTYSFYPSTANMAAIKAVTDLIPDAGAMTSIAQAAQVSKGVKKTISSIVTGNLFTVAGAVKVTSIVGVITTGIQATANATKLQFTPTGGSATDLCATLDITGSAIRKIFYITGTKADALAVSTDAGICIAPLASSLVLGPGILSINCAATSTGVIDWYIRYEPLSSTSSIS